MSSRAVWFAVILVLLVTAGFVAAGIAYEPSFFGVAAIIAAVAFGASMLGLMGVLMYLMGMVRELTTSVERITNETLPLLTGVNETIAGVNTEIARLDSIVASVQHISGTAENIADVVHAAVSNPLIKAIAFASGTGVAVRAARRRGR